MAKAHPAQFSPCAGRNFPTRVPFGDTHLHTAISVDAGTLCRGGQEDAFRFARGEEIFTTYGLRARLSRPLDFIIISDHAEMYGLMPQLLSGDPEILATEKGRKWHAELTIGNYDRIFGTPMEIVDSLSRRETYATTGPEWWSVSSADGTLRWRILSLGCRQPQAIPGAFQWGAIYGGRILPRHRVSWLPQ